MKIFICTSKYNYNKIPKIKKELELMGHKIILPNSFDDPFKELQTKKQGNHIKWKKSMLKMQKAKVKKCDAILILNYRKNNIKNYIGGATFLEIYIAFDQKKKIFLMNPIPKCSFTDELVAMEPVILNEDLHNMKYHI